MYFKSELNGSIINVAEISSLGPISETNAFVGSETINHTGIFEVVMKNGTVFNIGASYDQVCQEHTAISKIMNDMYGPILTTTEVLEGRKAPWKE